MQLCRGWAGGVCVCVQMVCVRAFVSQCASPRARHFTPELLQVTQRVRSIPAGVKERMTIRPFGKAAVGDNNTTSLGEEIGIDAPGAEVRPSPVDFFFFLSSSTPFHGTSAWWTSVGSIRGGLPQWNSGLVQRGSGLPL